MSRRIWKATFRPIAELLVEEREGFLNRDVALNEEALTIRLQECKTNKTTILLKMLDSGEMYYIHRGGEPERVYSHPWAAFFEYTTKKKNPQIKLNDRERELWVLNNEGLYNWFLFSRLSMRNFLRQNREEIDKIIIKMLSKN